MSSSTPQLEVFFSPISEVCGNTPTMFVLFMYSLTCFIYSEASEGLQHSVNEDAKVTSETPAVQPSSPSVPKLDRERSLNLTYGIASEDKIEAINRLLYASYHPDEPITNHLGLYKGPGSIPDADRRVRSSIKRNLSL